MVKMEEMEMKDPMTNNPISEEQQAVYKERAELFKALSSPVRLCILNRLIAQGRLNVSEIVSCMCVSQSSISQHLAKLRALGIVHDEKVENQVFYSCEREDVRRILNASGVLNMDIPTS